MLNQKLLDLDTFFYQSPGLFFINGYDGYLKKVNRAVTQLLDYPAEELYARPVTDFIHPEDRETTRSQQHLLHRGLPMQHFENRYLKRSGEVVWLSWAAMPVPEKGLVYATARDITHEKEKEKSCYRLLAHLTEINHELQQLSYTMSHNLRAPVSNILMLLSLLENESIKDPEMQEFFNLFQSAAQTLRSSMEKSVEMISDISKVVKQEKVLLQSALDAVLPSISMLLEHSRGVLDVDFSQCPEVFFSRPYLESIFLNLISNALKYAHPQRPPYIRLNSVSRQSFCEIIVEDNGLGMDLESVGDRVFGLGQTFHENMDSKGIGLYLIQHQVKSLGGKINLESTVNQGSRFTLSFPEYLF